MDYQKYIKSELLVLVPVLYIIGLGLKKSKLADKWIPLALGILAAGASVYASQLHIQAHKEE